MTTDGRVGQDGAARAAPQRMLGTLPLWFAVLVLAVAGGVVPVLVARHFGALGIPRNDDWSYLLSAVTLGETGRFDGNGWVTVSLVGQLVLAMPVVWVFGSRIEPLQLLGVVLGIVGLVAVFDLGRVVLTPRRGLFVALGVAVGPLWGPLAVSFMTDIPSFALAMVALALGARALRPDGLGRGLFVGALGAGFVAATIRDSALVAVLAVAVVALWCSIRWTRAERRFVVGGLVVVVVAFVGFWWWKQGLPGFGPQPRFRLGASAVRGALRRSQGLLVPLGLLTVPAVLLAGPVRLVRRSWARAPVTSVVVGGAVAVAVITWLVTGSDPFGPGNYLAANGTLGSLVLPGDRPDLFGPVVTGGLALVGGASATVLAVAGVRAGVAGLARARARRWAPPSVPGVLVVATAALGFAAFTFASRAIGNALWDRYLLPLAPLVSVLVLRVGADAGAPGSATRRRVGGVVGLVGLALVGGTYWANSASYDGARWAVGDAAARAVGGPARVDGGFEWDDYHAGREVFFNGDPRARACVVVRSQAGAPAAGDPRVVAAEEVWGPTGAQAWIVARRTGPCRGP